MNSGVFNECLGCRGGCKVQGFNGYLGCRGGFGVQGFDECLGCRGGCRVEVYQWNIDEMVLDPTRSNLQRADTFIGNSFIFNEYFAKM